MNVILATILTFAIALAFLRLMDFFAHKGWIESKLSRKLIHIGTGPIFVLCWLMFPDSPASRWLAALVPLMIVLQFALVGLGVMKDDASVFHWLTRTIMLCWVHDGRAYKKLEPVIALHRQQLEEFRKRYWDYYDQLLAYRDKPTVKERKRLESQFDILFATETGYHDLDQRIAKTRAKRNSLLLVLQHQNCLCTTMLLNWRFDSESESAM